MSGQISVVAADDHPLFLDGLRQILEAADFKVVGTASDMESAIALIASTRPTVALLDVIMPGGQAKDLVVAVRKASPSTRVVMLSMSGGSELKDELRSAGASAFLHKTIGKDDLCTQIRAIARTGLVALEQETRRLSRLECRVLTYLADGYSLNQVARNMHYSTATTKRMVARIYQHLGVNSRAEAISAALRDGYI